MSSNNATGKWWTSPVAHALLLAAVCLAVYSNNFHHEFQLDDAHVLSTNLAVRSLTNIPSYFVEPGTFTSLRANVDYRPVLQTTYALNYRMGGYDTFWWHFTQIMLHFVCVFGLYALCRRVLTLNEVSADPGMKTTAAPSTAVLVFVPLMAALIFALQPTESGVVNYLSARSSLLTAAFLLPAIVLYMIPRADARYAKTAWVSALLFTLALFTKVEAIACVAVFFLYDVWQTGVADGHRNGFFVDALHSLNMTTLRRMWPMLAAAIAYCVIRQIVMAPYDFEETRRAVGMTAPDYLLTQTVVWWQYVINWFAPVNLVADQGNYPVYHSLFAPRVAAAIVSWLIIGAALLWGWKKHPYLAFVAISALALLSPTSSIAPLAEMLNEHRPYLPIAVLSLAWMIPLGSVVVKAAETHTAVRAIAASAALLLLSACGTLTWQRNRVYRTQWSYLEDIVRKAPSGRALNNYGLLFLQAGRYREALDYFTRALVYTPYWHVVHTNVAIANRSLGNPDDAQKHFDLAIGYDQYSGMALTYRGENYLMLGRYADAVLDFQKAAPKSLERYRLAKGLATAYAGLGNSNKSYEATRECLALDSAQLALDAVSIMKPYFDSNALAPAGVAYFEKLDSVLPNTWWVQYNLGTLAGRMGDAERMKAAQARGLALKKPA